MPWNTYIVWKLALKTDGKSCQRYFKTKDDVNLRSLREAKQLCVEIGMDEGPELNECHPEFLALGLTKKKIVEESDETEEDQDGQEAQEDEKDEEGNGNEKSDESEEDESDKAGEYDEMNSHPNGSNSNQERSNSIDQYFAVLEQDETSTFDYLLNNADGGNDTVDDGSNDSNNSDEDDCTPVEVPYLEELESDVLSALKSVASADEICNHLTCHQERIDEKLVAVKDARAEIALKIKECKASLAAAEEAEGELIRLNAHCKAERESTETQLEQRKADADKYRHEYSSAVSRKDSIEMLLKEQLLQNMLMNPGTPLSQLSIPKRMDSDSSRIVDILCTPSPKLVCNSHILVVEVLPRLGSFAIASTTLGLDSLLLHSTYDPQVPFLTPSSKLIEQQRKSVAEGVQFPDVRQLLDSEFSTPKQFDEYLQRRQKECIVFASEPPGKLRREFNSNLAWVTEIYAQHSNSPRPERLYGAHVFGAYVWKFRPHVAILQVRFKSRSGFDLFEGTSRVAIASCITLLSQAGYEFEATTKLLDGLTCGLPSQCKKTVQIFVWTRSSDVPTQLELARLLDQNQDVYTPCASLDKRTLYNVQSEYYRLAKDLLCKETPLVDAVAQVNQLSVNAYACLLRSIPRRPVRLFLLEPSEVSCLSETTVDVKHAMSAKLLFRDYPMNDESETNILTTTHDLSHVIFKSDDVYFHNHSKAVWNDLRTLVPMELLYMRGFPRRLNISEELSTISPETLKSATPPIAARNLLYMYLKRLDLLK